MSGGLGGGMGGGGGGGMAMAHNIGPSGAGLARQMAKPPPGTKTTGGEGANAGGTAAPPANSAALGANLLDKNQNLGKGDVRNAALMPIVAVDLFGDSGGSGSKDRVGLAYYPPTVTIMDVNKSRDSNPALVAAEAARMAALESKPIRVVSCRPSKTGGNVGDDGEGMSLHMNGHDEDSHKAFRRFVAKGYGFTAVSEKSLCTTTTATSDKMKKGGKAADGSVVTVIRPQLLLGARRISGLHSYPPNLTKDADKDNIKAEEKSVTISNGTLDGASEPRGDDYDRVTISVRLTSTKKPVKILPEEAVTLMLHSARQIVHDQVGSLLPPASLLSSTSNNNSNNCDDDDDDNNEESYLAYPTAIAVPAWATGDAPSEALLEASGPGATLYPRALAALTGASIPSINTKEGRLQESRVTDVIRKFIVKRSEDLRKEALQRMREEGSGGGGGGGIGAMDGGGKNEDENVAPPLVLAVGLTVDGVELTAVRMTPTTARKIEEQDLHCPHGDMQVLATVSSRLDKSTGTKETDTGSTVRSCLDLLMDVLDESHPEVANDGGIAAIITYGSIHTQMLVQKVIVEKLRSIVDEDGVWTDGIPFLSTSEECVAKGIAVLSAISHGRILGGGGSVTPKPAIDIRNASTVAVGIQLTLGNGSSETDDKSKVVTTDVRTVFEHDQRVPAGPYQLDLTAAECTAMQDDPSIWMDTEKLVDEAKKYSGKGYIPRRETAALGLTVQILQRNKRDGEWIQIGDVIKPLIIEDSQEDNTKDEKDKRKIAVEESVMELRLDPLGIITHSMYTDG